MGDIAFLLIIFFMVCSNFVRESNIQYKSPTSVDVEPVEKEGISVVLDKDGKAYVDGAPVAVPELKGLLKGMMESRMEKSGAGASNVVFKCDMGLTLEQFQPTMEAIVGAGGIVIAVGEPRKEE